VLQSQKRDCLPSTAKSTSSNPVALPKRVSTSKTYSPSEGKSCVTTIPPRVPNGVPSMWSHACCETSIGFVYLVEVDSALGLPMASRLISVAALRYASIRVAESP